MVNYLIELCEMAALFKALQEIGSHCFKLITLFVEFSQKLSSERCFFGVFPNDIPRQIGALLESLYVKC